MHATAQYPRPVLQSIAELARSAAVSSAAIAGAGAVSQPGESGGVRGALECFARAGLVQQHTETIRTNKFPFVTLLKVFATRREPGAFVSELRPFEQAAVAAPGVEPSA